MSNKKAKQARQAQKRAGIVNHKKHPASTWTLVPWSDYSEQQRDELKEAGISNEADYLRVLRDGVRSDETNDFYWWLTNYGVGFYRDESEFIQAIARRLGSIERDPVKKAATQGRTSGDLSHMRSVYAWNLKRGDRYFASPYSFHTPEGRTWLVRYLRDVGVTTLVVDTVDTGDFDIKDAIIIDLAKAA
jgi:hypothetical protein